MKSGGFKSGGVSLMDWIIQIIQKWPKMALVASEFISGLLEGQTAGRDWKPRVGLDFYRLAPVYYIF